MDGTSGRAARERQGRALPIVSAWASATRVVLGQEAVRAKGNEITAIPELRGRLDLTDQVTTQQTRSYLSSRAGDARSIARAVRSHWGIETQGHWVLDVAFREDASRARIGHSTTNLASIRTLARNLFRRDPTRRIGVKGSCLTAGWDDTYLLHHVLGVHAADEMR